MFASFAAHLMLTWIGYDQNLWPTELVRALKRGVAAPLQDGFSGRIAGPRTRKPV